LEVLRKKGVKTIVGEVHYKNSWVIPIFYKYGFTTYRDTIYIDQNGTTKEIESTSDGHYEEESEIFCCLCDESVKDEMSNNNFQARSRIRFI